MVLLDNRYMQAANMSMCSVLECGVLECLLDRYMAVLSMWLKAMWSAATRLVSIARPKEMQLAVNSYQCLILCKVCLGKIAHCSWTFFHLTSWSLSVRSQPGRLNLAARVTVKREAAVGQLWATTSPGTRRRNDCLLPPVLHCHGAMCAMLHSRG